MKVRGLGEENYFEKILVGKAANRHSFCEFRQRTPEENFSVYQNAVGKEIGVETDSGRPIFFGEVTEVLIEQTYHGSYVEIRAESTSLKTDEEPQTRIFQNPEKKFGEVLSSERLKLKNCAVALDDKLKSQPCKEIILQDAETNFEFVKRLAAWQGRRVWVKDTWQGKCELKVAACSDESANKISQDEIISLKLGRRGKIRTAKLVAQKYFELGRILSLGDNPCKYLIVGLEIYQERGVDRMCYALEEFKNLEPAKLCSATPIKLKATVKDITDKENFGRLQVQFEIEDKDEKKSWLPYRTPYSGIIFLPEIGETVEIFYTQGECYAASTLRTKTLDDEFKNVKDKFIGNNRKQRIFFREKSLEIKSLETSIFMDEKKIVLSVGTNKIVMDEQGISIKTGGKLNAEIAKEVLLKAGESLTEQIGKDISSKAGGKISVDSGGNTSFKVGGKFEADASSAKIKGSSVELG